jgi:hypothetical protein
MAVPNSSPRASAVVSIRNPQRLTLADGTFFPPGCCAIPLGRASTPKPCRSMGAIARFFHSVSLVFEVLVSLGIGGVSADLGGAIRMYQHLLVFSVYPGGVAVR